MNVNNYCIIMAGGVGSRFWPMSTSKFPKQYHDVLGTGKTLIQQTFNRLKKVAPVQNIFIITNKEYIDLTLEQLPEASVNQVIGEPIMMNTSACNLYMAKKINQLNPNAKIIVAPSDHIILNEDDFIKKSNYALNICAQKNNLITLGIKPSRPDTGYGYIQYVSSNNVLKKVKTFTEKPSIELAEKFLTSGDFLWNAGIFIWSANSILAAFKKHLPEMYQTFSSVTSYNTDKENKDIAVIYPTVTKTSIDYGIMEKADNVYVIPSDFGWSDLGTWNSLFENFEKDQNNNAINGKWIKAYNSRNNIIQTQSNKAIVIQDLNGYIVADTDNALLICPLNKDQKVKEYVNDLRINKGERFL